MRGATDTRERSETISRQQEINPQGVLEQCIRQLCSRTEVPEWALPGNRGQLPTELLDIAALEAARLPAPDPDDITGESWDRAGWAVWNRIKPDARKLAQDMASYTLQERCTELLAASLVEEMWNTAGSKVHSCVYGQHEAGYLSFYDYMDRVLGIEEAQQLRGVGQVAQSAGWWWPFEGAAIGTERPKLLHRDEEGRVHCEDGPAVLYPDGFSVHAWHGVRVPAALIAGEWTPEDILREPNLEVRRCAIERMGWDWFITAAGLQQVGEPEDDPGSPGQVLRLYDVPGRLYETPTRVILCHNATVEANGERRRFGLTVPARFDNPVDAMAWTFRVPADVYRATARAT